MHRHFPSSILDDFSQVIIKVLQY